MSATVDSLSIKVDASARSASKQLDNLVEKMIKLRSTVDGISVGNLNNLSLSIQNFSKAAKGLGEVKSADFTKMAKGIEKLSNIRKGELNRAATAITNISKALSSMGNVSEGAEKIGKLGTMNPANLDKSAQSAKAIVGSMQRVSQVSKKSMSVGLGFDTSGAQSMQQAIQRLSSEYANVGKGKTYDGSLGELEKQADKLRKTLDNLSEKEERILTVGGTSPESTTFKRLQYDIAKTINQLSELEQKIEEVRAAMQKDASSIPIFRYDAPDISKAPDSGLPEFQEKTERVFQKIPESAKYSVEDAQRSLQEAMKEAHAGEGNRKEGNSGFRNYTREIKELEGNLKSLEQPGKGMGSKEWDEAYIALHKVRMEAKDYKDTLLRPWKEGDQEIKKTNSLGNKVEELKAKLKEMKANGLNFGDADFDTVYKNLQRTTTELKEYKATLNKPTTGVDEEVKKTNSLGNKVEELKTKLKDLQAKGLNFGDAEYDKTYHDLQKLNMELKKYKANVADSGRTVKTVAKGICDAFRSIWNQTRKTGSAVVSFGSKVKNLTTRFHSMSSSTNGLVGKLMKLYIGFRSLRGVSNFLKDSVESSMDYIETYNYFRAGFGQVASNADLGQWKELGFRSARQYAESFQNEAEKLTAKMTGFKVQDNGELISTGLPNLGMDPDKLMNYQAMFAQMSSSMGVASGTATDLSRVLTEIGADLASVKNIDFKSAWEDMASGLTGMSRTWDKYGVNIRNANLKQKLHELGIKANINALGQNDKALLRTIVLLESTKYAWGDMSSTINQPANQLRLLKNNFSSISRQIGNIFLPIVAKTLPYLNAFAIAVRRLVEYVGSLLGVNTELFKNTGGDNSGLSDLMDDAESASTAVDDTTDSVKKLSKQLMGFDELNVITTNDSKKKDKEDEDSGANITGALTDALDDIMSDYQKVWNKKFKEMQNDAERFADKLTKLFKDAWTTGDGSDIGSAIAGWLNKGISWVNKNVDKFAAGLKKIANMLATGVNGFVEKLDWDGLGTAIGKSLKAFFDAETHFFDKVNWVNLGKSLATSLNSAVDTGVLQSYFKSIASKLRAAIETAFGAVTTFKFDKLGNALGQGINDFFKTMGKVNKQTGLNGWQELGKTLSDGISGIAESLAVALETVEWEDVGQAIADFIGEIDTGDIGWKLGKLAKSLATAFYTLVSDKATWTSLGTKIADGINQFFKSMNTVDKKTGLNGWETLGESISNTIKGITETITTALETVEWLEVGNAIGDLIASIKWGEVAWDFVKMADEAFGAVCDAIAKIQEKAPLETAIVELFTGLALTGILGKIADAITLALAGKNLTLGKVAIGLGLGLATFKLMESDSKVANYVLAPITAALMGKTFGLPNKTSLTLAGAVFAFEAGFDLGKELGEWIQDQMSSEDMDQYRYDFKFSDLFAYSPSEWKNGFSDLFSDLELDTMIYEIISGDYQIHIPFTDVDLPSRNTVIDTITKFIETLVIFPLKLTLKIGTTAAKFGKTIASFVKGLPAKAFKLGAKIGTTAVKFGKSVAAFVKKLPAKAISLGMKIGTTVKNFGKTIQTFVGKAVKGISGTIKLGVEFAQSAANAVINFINKVFIKNMNKLNFKFPEFDVFGKKVGGWKFGFNIPEIKGFASGGFPQQGQYFLARESGPELVGTIGSKSAVVNNPQIVQSVSDGVFNALAPVLTQVVNAVNGLQANSQGGQPLYVEGVSDGDIVRITTRANSDYKKRFGKPLYI